MTSTTERGYAKLNLSLDVTGRLENGYHLVKMIMTSISLYDELTFTQTNNPGIVVKKGESSDINIDGLSLGDDNLITKAAKAILSEENLKRAGFKAEEIALEITLNKNIPMAAGMAGGSADAAATLRGLNRLYGLNLSVDELCRIGVKLGADVPFCVREGCYLSEGIGEVLTKLPNLSNGRLAQSHIALIKPPIDVSTKFVYEHLDTKGVDIHPDVDGQVEAIKNEDVYQVAKTMRNVLRDVTVPAYPIVLELEEFLKEKGALNAMMTGSGSTVYGIFDDEQKCKIAIAEAKKKYPDMYVGYTQFT